MLRRPSQLQNVWNSISLPLPVLSALSGSLGCLICSLYSHIPFFEHHSEWALRGLLIFLLLSTSFFWNFGDYFCRRKNKSFKDKVDREHEENDDQTEEDMELNPIRSQKCLTVIHLLSLSTSFFMMAGGHPVGSFSSSPSTCHFNSFLCSIFSTRSGFSHWFVPLLLTLFSSHLSSARSGAAIRTKRMATDENTSNGIYRDIFYPLADGKTRDLSISF